MPSRSGSGSHFLGPHAALAARTQRAGDVSPPCQCDVLPLNNGFRAAPPRRAVSRPPIAELSRLRQSALGAGPPFCCGHVTHGGPAPGAAGPTLRQLLDFNGEMAIAEPEIGSREVIHSGLHRPASNSASARWPASSSRPAGMSASIWRSQASARYSSNHREKAVSSSAGSWVTADSSSCRLMVSSWNGGTTVKVSLADSPAAR